MNRGTQKRVPYLWLSLSISFIRLRVVVFSSLSVFPRSQYKGNNESIIGDVDFHSHPSGDKKVPGGTAMWVQPPSNTDIKTATGKDYVFAMKEKTIYIYTNKGVIATIPISIFKK